MYTLEERLRDMKIDSGFKSLNYAICVMCILEGDEKPEEQLRSHLPRCDVAWARSLHLLSPVPEILVRNWLRNLLKPIRRDLFDRQKKAFRWQFQALRRRRTSNDAGSDFTLPRRFRLEYEWSRKSTHSIKTCTLPLLSNKWKKIEYFLSSLSTIFLTYLIFQESSHVIVCHEFCMNAFDHVFGKVFGKV